MNSVVIDTNVFIAALRSQHGASFEVLRLAGEGRFRFCLSVPLILEYEAVAKRVHRQLGLSAKDIDDVLDHLCAVGTPCTIEYLWRPISKDPKDDMILELAVNAQASAIVTFNTKDLAPAHLFGIKLLTPKEFLQLLKERS